MCSSATAELGKGSGTFRSALLWVALAVSPGEVNQHPLPLLRLSHQWECFQERPAKRKWYLKMSWINLLGSNHAKERGGKGILRAARNAFVLPPVCAPLGPCRCNAKGFYGASSDLCRETCCQLRSDPPLAQWQQDGLSIPMGRS